MRILYMGTPDFASAALKAIHESQYGTSLVGVVTKVDTPKNRGHKLLPPPVKTLALEIGLPVYQPETLKDGAFLPQLEEMKPDLIIVAAYGKILPEYVLNYPKYGCINIHGSLLPKYRGAAPIQRAIMDGDRELGITIIKMAKGIDTGDMLIKESLVFENESYGEIHDKLAELGGKMIVDAIGIIERGEAKWEKQDDSLSFYAEKIEKKDCFISFEKGAVEINNKIRALSPAPCAEAKLCEKTVKFSKATVIDGDPCGEYGEIVAASAKGDGFIDIKTGCGTLRVLRLIPEGKKEMSAGDFLRGRGAEVGNKFEKKEIL